jgi:hypothetical protein
VELATFLIEKSPESTAKIYKEVYEPLLRMQYRVSRSELNSFFPEQDPIDIEDDVLP